MRNLLSKVDFLDVLILAGLGMVGYGLSAVSVPLAVGVVGGILVGVGLVGAWRRGA